MTTKVRVGVVGTSWWADLMHLPSLASHPAAELAAICGRAPERTAKLANKYAIPQVYTDYRAMIDQADLDALVVATPDDLHCPMTLAGLDAGLHILCEKPLALTAEDARTMLDRAEKKGVVHMTNFTWRWVPHYRQVHELVTGGYVGSCRHATFTYLTGGGDKPAYSWRYDPYRSTGALGNLGAHMIDLARWCLGEVDQVSAHFGTFVERAGGETLSTDRNGHIPPPANDAFFLNLAFRSGAHAVIQVSEVFQTGERYHEQTMRFHGDGGTLEADLTLAGTDLARGQVRLATDVRGVQRGGAGFESIPLPARLVQEDDDPADYSAPFLRKSAGARAFVDAIVAGQAAAPSFHDGLAVQEIMDAALQSHHSRGWVTVSVGEPVH